MTIIPKKDFGKISVLIRLHLCFNTVSSDFHHGVTSATDLQHARRQQITPVSCTIKSWPSRLRNFLWTFYKPVCIQFWSVQVATS